MIVLCRQDVFTLFWNVSMCELNVEGKMTIRTCFAPTHLDVMKAHKINQQSMLKRLLTQGINFDRFRLFS